MSIFVQWENNKTPLNAENLNVINDVAKQLGEDVAHLSDVVVDIDENFSAKVQNELTEVKSSINTINETTSRLQQQTSSNNTNITNIQRTIADNNSALEEKINTNKNNLTTLQSVVNDNKTELDGKITTNKNSLNTLQQNVNNINSTLDSKINVNKNKLDNLEQNINNVNSTLDGKITTNKNNLNTLQQNVNNINSTLEGKIATNKDNISNIQNSLLTGQYTSYSGTNLTCNDTLSSKTSNMVIKGQTYQNLCGLPMDKEYSTSSNTGTIINIDYKLFKQNTLYTCIVYVKHSQNISCDAPSSYLRIQYKTGETLGGLTGNITTDYKLFKFRFTTVSNDNYILINQRNSNGGTQTFKNMIILEGDWTNKEVPSSITGIESVGEKENNKISILSQGKNLFNKYLPMQASYNGAKEEILETGIKVYNDTPNNWSRINKYFRVKPNTNYFVNFDLNKDVTGAFVSIKTPNGDLIKDLVTSPQSFNSLDNELLVVSLYCTTQDTIINAVHFTNFSITEGTRKPSSYIKYQEDKKEILLPIEGGLKSLPNGICDTIEQREDGIYLVQRVRKFNLSDLEYHVDVNSSDGIIVKHFTDNIRSIGEHSFLSNMNIGITNAWDFNYWKNWSFPIGINTGNMGGRDGFELLIQKRKITEITDVETMKNYFRNNSAVLYLKLKNPIETKLDIKDINVETFGDLTYISTNNNIQPELEFKIPSNLGALIQNNAKKINELFKLIDELIIPQLTTNTSNIAVLQITK